MNNIMKSPKTSRGGVKRPNNLLLIAVFAGCISFGITSANAEDSKIEFPSVPKELNQGTLDYLHANNVKMPGTEEVYPESFYTLTEIEVPDTSKIPDGVVTKYEKQQIIKYFDPVTGQEVLADKLIPGVNYRQVHIFELVPKYYKMNYKNVEYGKGNSTKYFKWEKDEKEDYKLQLTDENNAQITVHYDADKNTRKEIDTDTDEINQEFVDLSCEDTTNDALGGAIYNKSTIQNIKGDFIGNYTKSETHNALGGAIDNNWSTIGDITGNFIGNYTKSETSSAQGGAIANIFGTIGNIKGNFIGNYTYSDGEPYYNVEGKEYKYILGGAIINTGEYAKTGDIEGIFAYNYARSKYGWVKGGAISNESGATIQNIKGDFIGNYIYSEDAKSEGGAIASVFGTIGNITGNFIKNHTYSKNIEAYGGAVMNYNSTIGDIEGNFKNNYAYSESSHASGGAIKNDAYDNGGKYSIGDIKGDFIENYAKAGKNASGGAVFNENDAEIGNITGDFIKNYAESKEESHGGAIYNYKGSSIGDITGDFIDNYSYTTGDTSHGGVIDNRDSIIGKITGDFIGNYAKSTKNSFGGAIYNYNTDEDLDSEIGDLTGDFKKNYVEAGDNAIGGAIYNQGAKIGNIEGDFSSNFAKSASGQGQGGAIANTGKIGNIHGDFTDNTATTYGGAIYNAGTIGNNDDRGIYNSNFYDNNAGEHGGAIYTTTNINIIADNFDSLFRGNYVNTGENKDFEAIYVDGADGTTLTLNAKNNGTIQFDDKINGTNNYSIKMHGDDSSRVIFNNIVGNANATLNDVTLQIGLTDEKNLQSDVFNTSNLDVQSGFVDTADVKYGNYSIKQLKSSDEAEYSLDIAFDGNNGQSDTFSVGSGSTGTIQLSNLVINTINGFKENAEDEKEYFIQIIKQADRNDDIQLSIDKIHHITQAENNMNSRDILAKEFAIGTKDTTNDSIQIAGWRDSLAAWAELDTEDEKVFTLNGHDKQLLTRDAKLVGKNFTIEGKNGNVLNLNDKTLLDNISDDQNVTLSDLRLLNADNIQNKGSMTLDSVKLENTSKITNNNALTIQGKTNINGTITSDIKDKGALNFNSADTNITGKVENQNITGTADSTINLYNRNEFKNNSLDLTDTTLNVFDLGSDELHLTNLAVNNSTVNIDSVNVDLANVKMGRIISDNYGKVAAPSINIKDMKVLNDAKSLVTDVLFTDSTDLAQGVFSDVTEVEGPVFKYLVSYSSSAAKTRSINSDSIDGGIFRFTRGDVNPNVMAGSVAQLAGGYASMIQSLEFAFEHADTFSALPQRIRQAKSDSNKYAINEADTKLLGYANEFNSKGLWFKPYTSFESIPIKNGYDVDTVIYGSYVGGDSELVHLKNGWDTVTSAYIGYTGSSQAYQGNHTYQNGIVGGVTQTFYKDNFYTAITASVGSSIGETSTKYGEEDFSMLMAGAASKTGYNFEFKDGRFIIQPTLLMAYTMINTFDYTNAAGVNINAEPLHALQVHPYIKFVQNTESGWQPYLSAGFVYNVMGSTQITADEFTLPSLSIKPYAEYGLGIQKLWNDKYTGYLQAMVRNGGRNGVAFTAGFRMALGDEEKIEKVQKDNNIKPVNNEIKTVKTEPNKAEVKKADNKVKAEKVQEDNNLKPVNNEIKTVKIEPNKAEVKKVDNKVKTEKVQKVKKSDNKVKVAKTEKKHPLLNKISNFFSGNNSDVQPTGEKKIFKQLTYYERQAVISKAN